MFSSTVMAMQDGVSQMCRFCLAQHILVVRNNNKKQIVTLVQFDKEEEKNTNYFYLI